MCPELDLISKVVVVHNFVMKNLVATRRHKFTSGLLSERWVERSGFDSRLLKFLVKS